MSQFSEYVSSSSSVQLNFHIVSHSKILLTTYPHCGLDSLSFHCGVIFCICSCANKYTMLHFAIKLWVTVTYGTVFIYFFYIYVMYKLRFYTSCNLYSPAVQVATCTTTLYELQLVQNWLYKLQLVQNLIVK